MSNFGDLSANLYLKIQMFNSNQIRTMLMHFGSVLELN